VAVIVLSGSDIGEFRDLPMRELQEDLSRFRTIELFVDARAPYVLQTHQHAHRLTLHPDNG
jgi:hypothetical protein